MKMYNMFLCALINFRKWVVNPKIYTLFALILVFNIWNFSGVYDYARMVGEGVSPWMFPHLLIYPTVVPIYGFFTMLLFSDAPFIDRHMPLLLVRTGRMTWLSGQLLYIVLTSLAYTMINFLITIISFIPYIDFTTDWGRVIRTLAVNPSSASNKGIQVTTPVQNSIVSSFSAIEATLISLVLFFLVTLFIGIVIFSLNLILGKMSGVIVVGVLVFISYFSIFVGQLTVGLKIYYFSPLSWMSLQYIDWHSSGASPSFAYAITFLLVTSIILIGMTFFSFAKQDINTAEGLE